MDEFRVDEYGIGRRHLRLCKRIVATEMRKKENRDDADARHGIARYWRCIVHSVSMNIALLPGGVRRLTLASL